MKTNDFENALYNSMDKCNNFLAPFPLQIAKGIPNFLLELLLDIYCEKKAFYSISPNKLFENVEAEGTISSKSTLNKKYKKFFKLELKQSPNYNNYTFDFLYNSYIEGDKNGKSADKLYTYNDHVLGIIIGNWEYMPFNPRNFSHRLGNKIIPAEKYEIFFKLNDVNSKNLSNDFDKLVYIHLTDHYFNINLLCQLIYSMRIDGIIEDYSKKIANYVFGFSAIIFPALCELPSWNLKRFFWETFVQYLNTQNASEGFVEILKKGATDIYNFSLVYYPMYKFLLKNELYAELNEDDEVLFSYIKNFISLHAKEDVNLYPDYSIKLMEKIENIDEYLLTTLTKDFYSMYTEKFLTNDKGLIISRTPTTINNYYQKVNEIVRHRIRIISKKSI